MREMEDLLQQYMADNRMFHFDGERGVGHMKRVFSEVCGYRNEWGGVMENFFADNPGAIEAVMEWIATQRVNEWQENLEQLVGEEEAGENSEVSVSDNAMVDKDLLCEGVLINR